jgi:DNA-binding CsgD family transcriptional regulator
MPDLVVILFMFAVVTSFGIIWVANDMRLRFQARYLEYCFYFTLVTVTYGFVNWIAPFIVLYLTDAAGDADPIWSVAVFILIGVPLLLTKLYLFVLMFQELLARRKALWLNKFSLGVSVVVLLLTVWSIKSLYDGGNVEQVRNFFLRLGITAVTVQFLIIIHYLVAARGNKAQVLGRFASPFGLLFLVGYAVYVFTAYSAFLLLSPYLYFIANGLPIVALWVHHLSQPLPVLSADAPKLTRFIEDNALTPREADILKKIIRGASNKEIAEQSFISPHTVRNHIYNIYRKTGIKNRFQLLALFQED